MMRFLAVVVLALPGAYGRAQEAASPPAAEVSAPAQAAAQPEKPAAAAEPLKPSFAPPADQAMVQAPKTEAAPKPEAKEEPAAAPAPKTEAAPKPEAKEELAPAPAPKPEVKAVEAAPAAPAAPAPVEVRYDPAAEWKFLKSYGEDARPEVTEAVLNQLKRLLRSNPESNFSDEARLLLSSLHMRTGDAKAAVLDLLQLLYENPESKLEFQAKRTLADIVDRKMERKLKPILSDMARVPDISGKPSRLAALLKRVVESTGDSLYEPAVPLFEEFFSRYPDYGQADGLLLLMGQLHANKGKYQAAVLAYRELPAVFPQSGLRAKAQRLIGDVLAANLKDYPKAIDAYQEVTARYPDSPEAGLAYEQIAKLEETTKQYELALDVYEKIVKVYPNSDSALRAFNGEARLLNDYLARPGDAIKVYGREGDMFKGTSGAAKALKAAALLAHKQKDYAEELALDERLAKDNPDTAEAPEALYSAAQLCEEQMTELKKAAQLYTQLAEQYPKSKLAKKAKSRAKSLTKKMAE